MGYIDCTGVGLSVLLVSTCRAMREPLLCGTSDERVPRFFYVYTNSKSLTTNLEPIGINGMENINEKVLFANCVVDVCAIHVSAT